MSVEFAPDGNLTTVRCIVIKFCTDFSASAIMRLTFWLDVSTTIGWNGIHFHTDSYGLWRMYGSNLNYSLTFSLMLPEGQVFPFLSGILTLNFY